MLPGIGQQKGVDSIYKSVEISAEFIDQQAGLQKYFVNRLSPILSEWVEKHDQEIISHLNIRLTINKAGHVTAAELLKFAGDENCTTALIKELLTMKGWTPAKIGSKPVSSFYDWQISCILWNFEDR
jgi:hypothetical protein